MKFSKLQPVVPSPSSSSSPEGKKKKQDWRVLVGWAIAFASLAGALGTLQVTHFGPSFNIGLHFGSHLYRVHDASINWMAILASLLQAVICGVEATGRQSAADVVYAGTPVVFGLMAAHLAVLSRMQDGFLMALVAYLGFACCLIDQSSLRLARDKNVTDKLMAAWWQVCSVGGWTLLLVVMWFTAAWNEQNDDSPNYALAVLAVATFVFLMFKAGQAAVLLGVDKPKWLRDNLLYALELALLAVIGFLPMFA